MVVFGLEILESKQSLLENVLEGFVRWTLLKEIVALSFASTAKKHRGSLKSQEIPQEVDLEVDLEVVVVVEE